MSAIATLYVIDEPSISSLKEAAAAGPQARETYFAEHVRKLDMFNGSGWIFATLLAVLDEKYDIHLLNAVPNIIGVLDVVFTAGDRDAYLTRLDPSSFSLEDLRRHFEEFNETTEPEAGEYMRDGIAFLREGLRNVTPETTVLLTVD